MLRSSRKAASICASGVLRWCGETSISTASPAAPGETLYAVWWCWVGVINRVRELQKAFPGNPFLRTLGVWRRRPTSGGEDVGSDCSCGALVVQRRCSGARILDLPPRWREASCWRRYEKGHLQIAVALLVAEVSSSMAITSCRCPVRIRCRRCRRRYLGTSAGRCPD